MRQMQLISILFLFCVLANIATAANPRQAPNVKGKLVNKGNLRNDEPTTEGHNDPPPPTTAPPPPTEPETAKPPPATTEKEEDPTTTSPTACSGHGKCQCDFGYTGDNCDEEVNWCEELVSEVDGKPVVNSLCGNRGQCVSSPAGARCICHDGFSGQFCDQLIEDALHLSKRCLAYNISMDAHTHWSPNDQIGCKGKQECVPDDLQCLLTACPNPIGWCLPNERATNRSIQFQHREFDGHTWFYKKNLKNTDSPCSGHGTCDCDSGYAGDHCENEVDWCHQPALGFDPTGPIKDICGPNGTCTSTPSGAKCICEIGYTGEFCNIVIPTEMFKSRRCYVYQPQVPMEPNVLMGCPIVLDPVAYNHACIPEDLRCLAPLSCKNPIGWCLPMVANDKLLFQKMVSKFFNHTA
jgi:hypothetical protein